MRNALALASTLVVGCTAITDVRDYTIDHDPCGPPRPACSGGRQLVFLLVDGDVARKTPEGLLDGVNLDGSDRTICGHADYVAPRGEGGIDNQLTDLATALEETTHMSIHQQVLDDFQNGRFLQLFTIGHVDDLTNDDCVLLESRRASFSDPTAPHDVDGDGLLDPNLTLDYSGPVERDGDACIVDGVLYARYPDGPVSLFFNGGSVDLTGHRRRMRAPIGEAGMHHGILAGSLDWVEAAATVGPGIPALEEFLASTADLDPSSIGANDCQSISYALTFEAVPATLGVAQP